MNVALVGLGNAGLSGHLPAITQLQREGRGGLVAGADLDPARRSALSGRQPGIVTFESAEELLDSTRPDVVAIATHPRDHTDLAEIALARGVHVICEKPLALDRNGLGRLRHVCDEDPTRALVPVYQYRYSPIWSRLRCWAHGACRLRLPYALKVVVERPGIDPGAVSGWRADATSGGILADAGVHFLALASTVGTPLSNLTGSREIDADGNEQVTVRALVGSGSLSIDLRRGAPRRSTRIELRGAGASVSWADDTVSGCLGQRALLRRSVGALSDRDHVNSLYLPLYEDLAARLWDVQWRQRRTEEALAVANALVTLLERSEPGPEIPA